jgi:regulator of ribonuclease activity A
MSTRTTDLCDDHGNQARVIEEQFIDFGGKLAFHGKVSTLLAFEDNSKVREACAEAGDGRVLVIDAGGSMRRAMLGDQIAEAAVKNGWSGVVVFGCIRDSGAIADMDLGVKALGTCPRKTEKLGQGLRNVTVRIGGTDISPGDWLYADEDGVIVSAMPLHGPEPVS